MREQWKSIHGFDGEYEVSNHGRVRSLDRVLRIVLPNGTTYNKTIIGRILKPKRDKDGYLLVALGRNNTSKIHRLVASAFVDNPNGYPSVNHKDENKTNNHSRNLEWCSTEYNNAYGTCRSRSAASHQKKVVQLSLQGISLGTHDSLLQAENSLGIKGASTMICRCCKNKIKTAYGYKWKYYQQQKK